MFAHNTDIAGNTTSTGHDSGNTDVAGFARFRLLRHSRHTTNNNKLNGLRPDENPVTDGHTANNVSAIESIGLIPVETIRQHKKPNAVARKIAGRISSIPRGLVDLSQSGTRK